MKLWHAPLHSVVKIHVIMQQRRIQDIGTHSIWLNLSSMSVDGDGLMSIHSNARTVKEVNFFGQGSEYIISGR